MLTSNEVRQQFVKFFEERGHKFVPSSPVVPQDDPTLIFANAGMNQFKPYFLGMVRPDYLRAVNSQKCIRVSGKHNDLEEVGHDTYHHTFFEMLGNWSFGDYYKKEAIAWAWELFTKVWSLPKDRLYATIYKDDDEAADVWKSVTDIRPDHIRRFAEKDNFWEMGETGPCGPCSEIHIDLTRDGDGGHLLNTGSPQVIELWNLVFIQFNRDAAGRLTTLPAKHVDTGAGFERVTRVLQGRESNYDIDLFRDIIQSIEKRTKRSYEDAAGQAAFRVIADHVRMLTFAITDGAVPGNDGRGYVVRRILRRAAMYGRKLSMHEPFISDVVQSVVTSMGAAFPEIRTRQSFVERVIRTEEENFNKTLDRGMEVFEDIARQAANRGIQVLQGADVFKLYDTYGFPVDLTRLLASERGLGIDEPEFQNEMNLQRQRSRQEGKKKFTSHAIAWTPVRDGNGTEFVGYDRLHCDATVLKYHREGSQWRFVFDRTPFYAESGGQVGDRGRAGFGDVVVEIWDTQRIHDEIVHFGEYEGDLDLQASVRLSVFADHREPTIRNHSATHLLHAALRRVLGEHVHQSGSVVEPERLRFDFTHFEKVTPDQIREIEAIVNAQIRSNLPLQHHRYIPIEDAKKMGALMFFGDKYGDRVNVVQFGDFSKEFCGGTHAPSTSYIETFRVTSESSISAGVRRIEAVTGAGAEQLSAQEQQTLRDLSEMLNCGVTDLVSRVQSLMEDRNRLEKANAALQIGGLSSRIGELLRNVRTVGDLRVITGTFEISGDTDPKDLGDLIRNQMGTALAMVVVRKGEQNMLLCVVADELVKTHKIHAGQFVKTLASRMGGSGGGRPTMATAGIKSPMTSGELNDAIEQLLTQHQKV